MNIHKNKQKVIDGIVKVADAIAITLGASGKNVIIEEDLYPGFRITNDGYTILENTHFDDPLMQMGRNILFDAVSRANRQSGDGSTTTTVLTKAIIENGLEESMTGMELKDQLHAMLPHVLKMIDERKKVVEISELAPVVDISAESGEIGKMVQEIYEKIGKEGLITIEPSSTYETSYDIKDGVRLKSKTGELVKYIQNTEKGVIYENPFVLVIRNRINDASNLSDILSDLAAGEKWKGEVVIMIDDIDQKALGTLVANHQKAMGAIRGEAGRKYVKFGIIRAPVLWKHQVMEDFAKITGATIIDDAAGITFKSARKECAGTADKIIIEEDGTTVIGIKDVSEHVEQLRQRNDDVSPLRVAWLNTKACAIRVGAQSETELSYLLPKAEDAINAARMALRDGVVAGGGVCLKDIAIELENYPVGNEATRILAKSLMAPFRQICKNANMNPTDETRKPNIGLNAKTKLEGDMWEEKILDPAGVLKNAISNAVSVASTALTAEVILTKDRTEEEIARNFIRKQQQQF